MRSGRVAVIGPSWSRLSKGVSSVTRVMTVLLFSFGAEGEDVACACKAARWQGRRMFRGFDLFQHLHEDALHPPDVVQVHLQGSAACRVEALSKCGHCGTLLGGTALDAVGRPEGVGAQLGGIVGGIGGAATPGLARVDLDQPSPVVDAYQLAAQAISTWCPGGHWVDGTE